LQALFYLKKAPHPNQAIPLFAFAMYKRGMPSYSLQEAHLVQAIINDHPTVQNMARFYVYDMSRSCGHLPDWECPDDGLFACVDLKSYFTKPRCFGSPNVDLASPPQISTPASLP
jgi:hypothetical protein